MPSDEQDNPASPIPPTGPPSKTEHDEGPAVPPVPRPDRADLWRRMKRVDPDRPGAIVRGRGNDMSEGGIIYAAPIRPEHSAHAGRRVRSPAPGAAGL